MIRYYAPDGHSIPQAEWATLMCDGAFRMVAKDTLPNGRVVSTVWLGIDHGWTSDKVLIFESMAFQDGESIDCARYETLDAAKAGHAEMVEKWRAAKDG